MASNTIPSSSSWWREAVVTAEEESAEGESVEAESAEAEVVDWDWRALWRRERMTSSALCSICLEKESPATEGGCP